jgi:hypothetical protein
MRDDDRSDGGDGVHGGSTWSWLSRRLRHEHPVEAFVIAEGDSVLGEGAGRRRGLARAEPDAVHLVLFEVEGAGTGIWQQVRRDRHNIAWSLLQSCDVDADGHTVVVRAGGDGRIVLQVPSEPDVGRWLEVLREHGVDPER